MNERQVIGGRFEIADPERDLLGRGGVGDVYRGTDLGTGQTVAVKALRPEVVAGTPDAVARFTREGEALRELDHPNIVKLVDAVEDGRRHYLVMEYVPGGSLRDLLEEQGALPVARVVEIALDVADALTRAHRLGIIHRDLKPSNVLLAEDGTPRLSDFGIAHVTGGPRLTGPDRSVGTVDYMSPEACNLEPLDARTDIWSFGVMLYEMLAGERPFAGDSPLATLTAILTRPLPDLARPSPGAPDALVDLVYRMLEKDRSARIPSARLVGAELERIQGAISSQRSVVSGQQSAHSRPSSVVVRPSSPAAGRFSTPTPPAERPRHNLPAQTTPFVGRERELEDLARLLDDPEVRLVTVLGPGGMGKTRLALEVAKAQVDGQAKRFPDGVYLVSLAPLRSAEYILSTVAEAVGFQFYPGGDPERQLLDYLREKRILLLMDNYEHLLDGAGMVSGILQAAPGVQVLATSREKLDLTGETAYAIEGMAYPDWETPEDTLEHSAIRLFLQGARRTHPGYEIRADDLKYVVRICKLVGGMPLGLLLAAAWADVLSPSEIAGEIERSLDFLETEARDLPERQHSLRAVFESSWHRLREAEREAFARLSVFRGGCTREAAQAVTGAGLRTLMALTHKSLLHRNPDGRYEVHEWLRQYAERKLDEAPVGKEEVLDMHCGYYAEFVRRREVDATWRMRCQEVLREIDNVRAGWRRAVQRGKLGEIRMYRPTLDLVHVWRGWNREGAASFAWAADALAGDGVTEEKAVLLAQILLSQGIHARRLGQADERLPEKALALLREFGTRRDLAQGQLDAYFAGGLRYSYTETQQLFEESLATYQEMGDALGVAKAFIWLGQLALNHGAYEEADEYCRQALKVSREIHHLRYEGWTLQNLGVISYARGEYAEAERSYEESLALFREGDVSVQVAQLIVFLGDVALATGRHAEAEARYREGLAKAQEMSYGDVVYIVFVGLGNVALATGDPRGARRHYRQALRLAADLPRMMARHLDLLIGLATLLAREGREERATELAALVAHHPACWKVTRDKAQGLLEELRSQLPTETFAAAQKRGCAWDLEAAVSELLAKLGES